MWYFAWILGSALACTLGILNAIWFELKEDNPSFKTDENKNNTSEEGNSYR